MVKKKKQKFKKKTILSCLKGKIIDEAIKNLETLSAGRSIGTLAHDYACHIKAHGDNLL